MAKYEEPFTTSGAWFIRETGEDGISVNIRLTGPEDRTAGESTEYDPHCASCWLGHAHSGDSHHLSLAISHGELVPMRR